MSDIETLHYFARVAEKLENVAQELARMKDADQETAGRLHLIAEAIRSDMPVPRDLYQPEYRWDAR
jgi:hypothetical protein